MKKFHPIRIFIFLVSVISLSKFFEAGRLIACEKTFACVGVSFFSGIVFLLSLVLLSYWVYSDEKEKNNLKTKFKLYEWFYEKFSMRKAQK